MLTAARAKRFDAVVMMAPDRGAREMFRGGLAFFELAETGVIRRAFALAAEGFGDLRITQTLTAEAAPLPKRAPSWSKETIRTMLSNELYRGVLIYGKTRQAAEVGGVTKKRVAVPMDD